MNFNWKLEVREQSIRGPFLDITAYGITDGMVIVVRPDRMAAQAVGAAGLYHEACCTGLRSSACLSKNAPNLTPPFETCAEQHSAENGASMHGLVSACLGTLGLTLLVAAGSQ